MKRVRSYGRRMNLALLAGAGLVLGGCGQDKQSVFLGKGESSKSINDLQVPVFIAAGVVGLVVFGAVVYAMARFRDKPGKGVPVQGHGNPKVEVGLTLVSATILVLIAVPTWGKVLSLARPEKNPAVTVDVVGQQWWWEFDYTNVFDGSGAPLVTSGELVIPAGKPVQLRITSRDVIHSFWIPALNGKKDAVPNRYSPLRMEADKPGEYFGQCTEFCGLSHANMRMKVIALNDQDWKAWTENQAKAISKPADGTAEARGYEAFSRCVSCHQVNGYVGADGKQINPKADEQLVSGAAPNLTHVMSRSTFAGANFALRSEECMADLQKAKPEDFGQQYLAGSADCLNRAQLEAWLRNPSAVKPMAADPGKNGLRRGMPNLGLTEDQIDDLIAFLKTLK
jgi:cytochrome c oxidase subunit 2